jgi:hypothetical protein
VHAAVDPSNFPLGHVVQAGVTVLSEAHVRQFEADPEQVEHFTLQEVQAGVAKSSNFPLGQVEHPGVTVLSEAQVKQFVEEVTQVAH